MKYYFFTKMITVIAVLFLFGCAKNQKTPIENVVKLKTGKLLEVNNVSESTSNRAASCGCTGHGGTAGTNIQHYLATCKSNCERGLGFRCGTAGIYVCNDGTVALCAMGHCPSGTVGTLNPERVMNSTLTYYDNNTVKIQFLHPVPSLESTNTVFDVDGDFETTIPTDIVIGGIPYEKLTFLSGKYFVDYTDGLYGSVVISSRLSN